MADHDDGRVNLSELVGGARVYPLQPDWVPLDFLVLVKSIDSDQNVSWSYRATPGLNREELLGALRIHCLLLEKELVAEWADEDDDDDES